MSKPTPRQEYRASLKVFRNAEMALFKAQQGLRYASDRLKNARALLTEADKRVLGLS